MIREILQMDRTQQPGLYVYERTTPSASPVLKELLQLSKTVGHGKTAGFSFVHGQSSLIPTLTLWENLQLSAPHELWDDFVKENHPALVGLIPLIKEPYKKAGLCTPTECFLVSLMKGILEPTGNLLVDMDEEILSPFITKTVKATLMKTSQQKTIYLSSVASSMWLDCAHHVVKKVGFEFVFEKMDSDSVKKHWAA
jgi:ABC-type branched-subunit amino acid transport system ATPase component